MEESQSKEGLRARLTAMNGVLQQVCAVEADAAAGISELDIPMSSGNASIVLGSVDRLIPVIGALAKAEAITYGAGEAMPQMGSWASALLFNGDDAGEQERMAERFRR